MLYFLKNVFTHFKYFIQKEGTHRMNSVSKTSEVNELLKGSNVLNQLSVSQLVEKVIERNEGVLTSTGAVRATTGKYTGRSPKDKYIVEEESVKR